MNTQRSYLMARFRTLLIFFILLSAITVSCGKKNDQKIIRINESEFRDRVYACWLGKNIGGTLGMPFEGKTDVLDLTFFTNIKAGEPAPNDDLDLQLLWLKAMQENDGHVDAFTLGKYWLKYVPVNWNEYGIGKENMKKGLMPPVSGEFRNDKWKNSNGAWIRSEIWACLFPGNPYMAARFAREDACVDHGMAEGTFAEIFTASLESAAFVMSDRDSLINFGLSMIPVDCRVAKAVKTAVSSYRGGQGWKDARLEVINATEDLGWFQAPRNVAFTMIGWLYGEGDFGKSICIAVNCGDDTDCTGATLGSILGIIHGTSIIPAKWREPVGDKITNVAISGFRSPANLDELTDSTISMTRRVNAKYNLGVTIDKGKTIRNISSGMMRPEAGDLKRLWSYSPWRVAIHNHDHVTVLDYMGEPVIRKDTRKQMSLTLSNTVSTEAAYSISCSDIPSGWSIKGLPGDTIRFTGNSSRNLDFSVMAAGGADSARFEIMVTGGYSPDTIPFILFRSK